LNKQKEQLDVIFAGYTALKKGEADKALKKLMWSDDDEIRAHFFYYQTPMAESLSLSQRIEKELMDIATSPKGQDPKTSREYLEKLNEREFKVAGLVLTQLFEDDGHEGSYFFVIQTMRGSHFTLQGEKERAAGRSSSRTAARRPRKIKRSWDSALGKKLIKVAKDSLSEDDLKARFKSYTTEQIVKAIPILEDLDDSMLPEHDDTYFSWPMQPALHKRYRQRLIAMANHQRGWDAANMVDHCLLLVADKDLPQRTNMFDYTADDLKHIGDNGLAPKAVVDGMLTYLRNFPDSYAKMDSTLTNRARQIERGLESDLATHSDLVKQYFQQLASPDQKIALHILDKKISRNTDPYSVYQQMRGVLAGQMSPAEALRVGLCKLTGERRAKKLQKGGQRFMRKNILWSIVTMASKGSSARNKRSSAAVTSTGTTTAASRGRFPDRSTTQQRRNARSKSPARGSSAASRAAAQQEESDSAEESDEESDEDEHAAGSTPTIANNLKAQFAAGLAWGAFLIGGSLSAYMNQDASMFFSPSFGVPLVYEAFQFLGSKDPDSESDDSDEEADEESDEDESDEEPVAPPPARPTNRARAAGRAAKKCDTSGKGKAATSARGRGQSAASKSSVTRRRPRTRSPMKTRAMRGCGRK